MEKLKSILSEVLEIPMEKVTDDLSMENCESWTSLALVSMLELLENAFNVEFDVQEAIEMDSLQSIKEILTEKGAL